MIVCLKPHFSVPQTRRLQLHRYANGYSYLYVEIPERVTWTLGGSVSSYERSDGEIDKLRFNPKFGLLVELTDQITLRAGLSPQYKSRSGVGSDDRADHDRRFQQFYDAVSTAPTLSRSEQASTSNSAAASGLARKLIRRRLGCADTRGCPGCTDRREVGRAYAYFVMTNEIALSAEILHERSQSDAPFDFERLAHNIGTQ